MFHISRWKNPTLSALALSTLLAFSPAAEAKTITAVMHSDLRAPGMVSTAYIFRDFGYMIAWRR
jgi:peptide/nickel transport system substrate-binding protein